jgi:Arc/MetJ-type ribon-helix-helix transcriptional regulator
LRQALQTASREQVLQRVISALAAATETGPEAGLHGKVQKVSVSMPAEVTEAVRARTGVGGFSRYVSDAVQECLRHDQLGDLLSELEAEYGPVSDEIREQTRRMWPDAAADKQR